MDLGLTSRIEDAWIRFDSRDTSYWLDVGCDEAPDQVRIDIPFDRLPGIDRVEVYHFHSVVSDLARAGRRYRPMAHGTVEEYRQILVERTPGLFARLAQCPHDALHGWLFARPTPCAALAAIDGEPGHVELKSMRSFKVWELVEASKKGHGKVVKVKWVQDLRSEHRPQRRELLLAEGRADKVAGGVGNRQGPEAPGLLERDEGGDPESENDARW